MWLNKVKNELLNLIFPSRDISDAQDEMDDIDIEQEAEKLEEEIKKFKLDNVVFNKLNYLEQYIKIFSLTFPDEYNKYLQIIQNFRRQYEKELEEYKGGFSGNITFSIDPEHQSTIYIDAIKLEEEIKRFVEMEVNYKLYKEQFSKLCSKLNIFYNALFDTEVEVQIISNQLNNASESLGKIINEVKKQGFFEADSRKREELFNYIIYSEYIIFKSFLKISVISSFDEYKRELSAYHTLFVSEEYDSLIFKFLIEDLEQLQIFITDNLQADSMYQYILDSCQRLQNRLDDYSDVYDDYQYFQELIKFENTIYDLTEAINIKFSLELPDMLNLKKSGDEIVSVKRIASAILNLLNSKKAKLLQKIISGFSVEISWREFFFLCKVFEIYQELLEVSSNTIFSIIKDKFLKIEEKYVEYTDEYIRQEKQKVLAYNGTKTKKYILLITIDESSIAEAASVLDNLSLDFVVCNDEIYLNHMYFNGFKNLEENFGTCITF